MHTFSFVYTSTYMYVQYMQCVRVDWQTGAVDRDRKLAIDILNHLATRTSEISDEAHARVLFPCQVNGFIGLRFLQMLTM